MLSGAVGTGRSGLPSVFPLRCIVLAVFSHRSQGPAFAAVSLRGMAAGLYSFVAFCATLSTLLSHAGMVPAFAGAMLAAVVVQGASMRSLRVPRGPRLASR